DMAPNKNPAESDFRCQGRPMNIPNCPPLLRGRDMPAVGNLAIPTQFYTVAMEPVPIAGMPWPSRSTPWPEIAKLGFRHVICLASANPDYEAFPLEIACAIELEDLVGGHSPSNPDRAERSIRSAVEIALDKIQSTQ